MVKCPRASKQKYGYRVGDVLESDAKTVIKYEVEEMGNDPMLDYIGKSFNTNPTLKAISKAINQCFGSDARAIWLTRKKSQAEEYYGPGEADKIKIPKGAAEVLDLGTDGQLFIYKKQRLSYRHRD